MASVYGPLGFISSRHMLGKLIYRNLCDKKIHWDEGISDLLKINFKKWVQNKTNNKREIPRVILLTK